LWAVLAVVLAGASLTATARVSEIESDKQAEENAYEPLEVFASALQLIRQDFVDTDETSYQELIYSAMRGMLAELDPHSQFMEPEEFQGMQEDTRSEFGGLGAVVTLQDKMLTIVSPMEDSPVFEAGIEPGDQILRIDATPTDGLSLPEAIQLLRGDAGEKITLTMYRPRTGETKEYVLTREVIKVPSVKGAQILPTGEGRPRIGYIRITQFSEPTASEVEAALQRLKELGAQGLILDLRFNPGGLLNSAVDVAGLFLPEETEVVSTRGRVPGRVYKTVLPAGGVSDLPLVVLVNHASASGSEVLAGALKDLGRAIVLGETTFGKGSVQSVVSLPDGSAIRLTTAKYYTPSEEVIHERGVTPHIRAPLTNEEEARLMRSRRERRSETKTEDDVKVDPQLDRAISVLQGLLMKQQRATERQAELPET